VDLKHQMYDLMSEAQKWCF